MAFDADPAGFAATWSGGRGRARPPLAADPSRPGRRRPAGGGLRRLRGRGRGEPAGRHRAGPGRRRPRRLVRPDGDHRRRRPWRRPPRPLPPPTAPPPGRPRRRQPRAGVDDALDDAFGPAAAGYEEPTRGPGRRPGAPWPVVTLIAPRAQTGGIGGRRSVVRDADSGRTVGARVPNGAVERVAVVPTLQAAAARRAAAAAAAGTVGVAEVPVFAEADLREPVKEPGPATSSSWPSTRPARWAWTTAWRR